MMDMVLHMMNRATIHMITAMVPQHKGKEEVLKVVSKVWV